MSMIDECKDDSFFLDEPRDCCCALVRYVKRSLPIDSEHPREHVDPTTFLMVLLDFNDDIYDDPAFLSALGEYFSIYGPIRSCKYDQEKNFDYALIEFTDRGKL